MSEMFLEVKTLRNTATPINSKSPGAPFNELEPTLKVKTLESVLVVVSVISVAGVIEFNCKEILSVETLRVNVIAFIEPRATKLDLFTLPGKIEASLICE